MKLSVKWLAGLAVLVLAVVAVVGSTSATKAADGTIFVVNTWSKITNESPAPTGRTFRSSVYATINDGVRLIETGSDTIRVVVHDTDLDVTSTATATTGEFADTTDGTPNNDIINNTAGNSVVITFDHTLVPPIAGSLADVQANTEIVASGSNELNVDNGGTEVKITNFFAGNGSADGWIQLVVNITGPWTLDHISYQTSAYDQLVVTVKSDTMATNGVTVAAEETGLSTGIFEGFVQILPATSTHAADGPYLAGGDLDGVADPAKGAKIAANVGPITVSFVDSGAVERQSSALIDTAAPSATVSGPVSGSATQNRTPTFSGTVSESGAGLDVSTIVVAFDNSNDATNTTKVINTSTAVLSGGAVSLSISTSGAVDGDTAFSFSQIPSASIPVGSGLANPDHIVDWVIRASDLAGNIGLSDADASTTGVQLPTVKIDTVIPTFTSSATDHKTGLAWDGTKEVASRNSIRLAFNDQVSNVQTSDFTVTLDSTAVVVPTSVTIVNKLTDSSGLPFNVGDELLKALSTGASGARSTVYLTFANDLVSNETPLAALQDTISDLAGNFTSTGSKAVQDGIAPDLTITLSGGSGTGATLATGEGPDKLTKSEIIVDIETDEPTGAPSVEVFLDGAGSAELTPTALAQGANKWRATYVASGATTGSTAGKRGIKITATDSAANQEVVGSNDADASGTPNFRLDLSLASPTLSVGGGSTTTDQTRPSVVIDYKAGGEASTVSLTKVQLDGTDITSDVVASSDGQRFFYIPPSDLSLGDHKLLIESGDASDAAGNENSSDTTLTITVEERSPLTLDIFAGWNAVSFPSDPIDPDPNSVFDNAGHDAVLGFEPTVPGGWVVSVRDTVSGLLEPATEAGLTAIRSTQAYWVHSLNFEQISALLTGEVLPASGSPPGIVQIPTVLGFNAVPVVDTSRKQTKGNIGGVQLVRQVNPSTTTPVTVGTYLGAVVEGRVYKWNPEILSFVIVTSSTPVNIGDVLFVEVTGTPTPIFP